MSAQSAAPGVVPGERLIEGERAEYTSETAMRDRAHQHFLLMSHEEQVRAIHRLAADGFTDHGIAAATRLAVEQVRRILGERA